MHPYSIRTVRLEVGPGLHFFGDKTTHSVVVWPEIPGGGSVLHRRSRFVIEDGVPLRQEPSTSVDVPVQGQGEWVRADQSPAPAWSYRVLVTSFAPGRSPVLWTHTVTPTWSQRVIVLDPAGGGKIAASASVMTATDIDPVTGAARIEGSGGITGATTFDQAATAA